MNNEKMRLITLTLKQAGIITVAIWLRRDGIHSTHGSDGYEYRIVIGKSEG